MQLPQVLSMLAEYHFFFDIKPKTLKTNIAETLINNCEIGCCIISHLFGVPALEENDLRWLQTNKIPLIEDCAQSISGKTVSYTIGRAGAVSIYSFNGSKYIPAGEGGMIATDDEHLFNFCNNFLMTVDSPRIISIHRFNDASEGWNYRLGSISASLAASLINRVDDIEKNIETI
jgi:dTDP-4-amino-4,6-dideoxygalactose transaminase